MATMKSSLHPVASDLLALSRMKRWALGLTLCSCMGCVLPQEESYLSELPIPPNRPPRIVENQVQPSERIIRGYGTSLCQLDFSVIVEDPNLGDVISTNWWVDYDPVHPRGADSSDTLAPGQTAVRDERATFHSTFNSAGFNLLNTPGDHVVEVVISDTPLQGRDPKPNIIRLPDGTTFSDPGYSTSYVWFVRTEAGGNCP